jgi:hypothetical protein
VDFPGDESSFRNGGNFVTHLASPTTHVPSSTLTNHSETQISRKRRLSEVVGAETTHRSVVRRAENDRFRKESLESTPSPAAIEIADFAEPSTSAGDDLGISNSVKEELAQLCLLGRTQSSECPSRNEKDERRLKQDHLDKLYTLDADRYFCHACLYVLLSRSTGICYVSILTFSHIYVVSVVKKSRTILTNRPQLHFLKMFHRMS